MDIEKLATSAVSKSISQTERLSSFINSGDKEPCWDGSIYIHEGKRHEKKNIKKVSTQVKGKLVKSKAIKDKIKYQISYDDLYAYMMNGGTLFFVVYLNNKTGDTLQIYYSMLLPFKIKKILATKQLKYSVQFKKFPDDNIEKTELLLNYYNDAIRQTSFAGREIPTIDELSKQGILEGITFHYTGVGENVSHSMLPKKMDGKSLTIYANIKGSTVPIPIEYYDSIHQIRMQCDNNLPISVGDTKYYDGYKIITTAENVEFKIGSCMRVIIPNVEESQDVISDINVKIKIKGTLKERISGIAFVISAIKDGSFNIGKRSLKLNITEEEFEKINIDVLENTLLGYRRAMEVLNDMNVKVDLDIDKCTEEDVEKLNLIVSAIGDKIPVKESWDDTLAQLKRVQIANLTLAIVCLTDSQCEYRMFDYFSNHFSVAWKPDEKEEAVNISQFSMIKAEEYLEFSNVNFEMVASDFEKVEANSLSVELANSTMLELLKAFDLKPSKELLIAAKRISEWIKSKTEFISEEVSTINELQIVLRERALTFDEKNKLYNVIANSQDDFFRAGAFILLQEHEEVGNILKTFTNEQLECFKEFPIYRFYKETTEETSNGQT